MELGRFTGQDVLYNWGFQWCEFLQTLTKDMLVSSSFSKVGVKIWKFSKMAGHNRSISFADFKQS